MTETGKFLVEGRAGEERVLSGVGCKEFLTPWYLDESEPKGKVPTGYQQPVWAPPINDDLRPTNGYGFHCGQEGSW